jgi:hypothetical protein
VEISREEAEAHRLTSLQPLRTADASLLHGFDYVQLAVIVNEHGSVASATTEGEHPQFFELAAEQAAEWKFRPIMRGDKAVPVKFTEYIYILPEERLPKTHVPFPNVHSISEVVNRLERTACYGTCPAYSVEIRGDGSVHYDGRAFVAVRGDHSESIY